MLDNVVITEGEFTTDYFQKLDWRDMLDPEDLPESVRDRPDTTSAGVDVEQALLAAEDETDAQAALVARREMDLDVTEFAETTAVAPVGVLGVDSPVPYATSRGMSAEGAGASSATPPAIVTNTDDQEQVIGHVDEYMLRFAEREFGVYLGFGGLANPDSSIEGIGAASVTGQTKQRIAGGPSSAPTVRSKSASVPASTVSFEEIKEREEEDQSSVAGASQIVSDFWEEEEEQEEEEEDEEEEQEVMEEEDGEDEEEEEEEEGQESDNSETVLGNND